MKRITLASRLSRSSQRIGLVVLAALLAFAIVPATETYAAQITGRSVTIGSSAAGASTTYSFVFNVPSATIIRSAEFRACTTANGACTTPVGFSSAASALVGQPTGMGDLTGWTNDTNDSGALRITNSGNVTAPTNPQTVTFSNVTNPSATNATFFIRMTTYSDAAWTTMIDNGTVATSTAGLVTVTASVDETLTFTLGTTTVPLGSLTTASTGSNTSNMNAATNASSGYTITVSGTTLTSGSNTISALTTPTASILNTQQFGLNLVANTTPAVGSNPSGGSGAAATGYNTPDLYKFVSGDTVATSAVPSNTTTYTTSYIANIDGVTPPGSYATVLDYVATANF